jgi:hypothetical protein
MNDASPVQKKRPAWVLPIVITLGIIVVLTIVNGAILFFLAMGLQKTGSYLNGSPVTVSDERIERQVQEDLKWLPANDFAVFDGKLNLTDKEKLYAEDLAFFQQAGSCIFVKDAIKKAQGGLDGGASIRYDGAVACNGTRVYELEVRYGATVLGKEQASRMDSFRLQSAEITSEDGSRIDALSQRNSRPITLTYTSESKPTKGNWPLTEVFSSNAEYVTAITSGKFKDCERLSQLRMRTVLRWSEGVNEPASVKQDIMPAKLRCK